MILRILFANNANPAAFKNPLKFYSGDSVLNKEVLFILAGLYDKGPLYFKKDLRSLIFSMISLRIAGELACISIRRSGVGEIFSLRKILRTSDFSSKTKSLMSQKNVQRI